LQLTKKGKNSTVSFDLIDNPINDVKVTPHKQDELLTNTSTIQLKFKPRNMITSRQSVLDNIDQRDIFEAADYIKRLLGTVIRVIIPHKII